MKNLKVIDALIQDNLYYGTTKGRKDRRRQRVITFVSDDNTETKEKKMDSRESIKKFCNMFNFRKFNEKMHIYKMKRIRPSGGKSRYCTSDEEIKSLTNSLLCNFGTKLQAQSGSVMCLDDPLLMMTTGNLKASGFQDISIPNDEIQETHAKLLSGVLGCDLLPMSSSQFFSITKKTFRLLHLDYCGLFSTYHDEIDRVVETKLDTGIYNQGSILGLTFRLMKGSSSSHDIDENIRAILMKYHKTFEIIWSIHYGNNMYTSIYIVRNKMSIL